MELIRYFEVEYFRGGTSSVYVKYFRYKDEQPLAEAFCKEIKDGGGAVNIRIVKKEMVPA